MAWFKVDDGLHASRKLLSIPKRHRFAAVGLWTVAGSWCADQLTDGSVPDYMLEVWGAPPSAPQSLVDAGLWSRESGGYLFHNWHEYQPSKQDVDAERAASRERMRELRARRKQGKPLDSGDNGQVFGRTVTNGSENVRNPDPTRPDPTHKEAKASLSKRASTPKESDEFIEFYMAYPRREGRGNAVKAYAKALTKTDAETILEGARRYADDPNREAQYTKLPATWLNAESWSDEPLPARFAGQPQRMTHSDRVNAKHAALVAKLENHPNQLELGA